MEISIPTTYVYHYNGTNWYLEQTIYNNVTYFGRTLSVNHDGSILTITTTIVQPNTLNKYDNIAVIGDFNKGMFYVYSD